MLVNRESDCSWRVDSYREDGARRFSALMQEHLDGRERMILTERTFSLWPSTLQELGDKVGVSRERIRQLEKNAQESLSNAVARDCGLASLISGFRTCVAEYQPIPLAHVLSDWPRLSEPLKGTSVPLWRALERLDSQLHVEDEWCSSVPLSEERRSSVAALRAASDDLGVVPLSLATDRVLNGEASADWAAKWLESCGLHVWQDHVLTRTSSMNDRAAAVLGIQGSPLRSDRFPEFVTRGGSLGGLKNALRTDRRLMRVGPKKWALRSWGLDEYRNIPDAIRRELVAAQGQLPLDELVNRISSKYNVAPSSVQTFATNSPFHVQQGNVRERSEPSVGRRKTWQQTRRLYRRGARLVLRILVNDEHLRGSGFPVPVCLADWLHLKAGEEKCFLTPDGAGVVLRWPGMQPAMGTIRSLLLRHDIHAGDQVLLSFDRDGGMEFSLVSELDGHPWVRAAGLAGCAACADPHQALAHLCRAVGVVEGSSLETLVERFMERGESDLTELLLDGRKLRKEQADSPPVSMDEAVGRLPGGALEELLDPVWAGR